MSDVDPSVSVGAKRSPGRPAAFFDLDKTIIAKSSTLAFSREFYAGGLINRRSVLRSAYAQFVYLVGGADHDQMEKMRQFLSQMCTGWPVQTVRDIVGRPLTVQRVPFTIVGVMAPGFFGPDVGRVMDVMVPFSTDLLVRGAEHALTSKGSWWLQIMVRLKPGLDIDQANAALRAAPRNGNPCLPPSC